ncbi:hypothetical protein C488_19847 [Natrinema pellirubrum DSM 15624]|uniref:Uncharacterized protein n=1 Tax=Natrinema pellirubrum (strain DSM 15624 / CIP 106293 / JCM 10476 / NCIMB 786 / 157) TaxID=797303 RepID=L0JF34_NATP1|nr:hypothetical protein [Natrinema pellirubrum]AGB30150.1 hypothetical protein Natpe_0210 [Natrinema pellirubrum DSM 15624]ELY69856.1 hypothetical protein C488_19847 [Natrinema pellirubrum DSM 15624]
MQRPILTIAVALTLILGATGVAAAQPADGPPSDLPDRVPDFVSDLLETITDVLDGALKAVGEAIRSVTPGDVAAIPNGNGE